MMKAEMIPKLAEVLQYMSEGYSDEEIAGFLHLSLEGLKYRVKLIYNSFYKLPKKTGSKRALSVSRAIRSGLIRGPALFKTGLALTPREKQYLKLLAEGKGVEEIVAATTATTPLSVKSAFAYFTNKYGVRSRVHLMALALVHKAI